MKFIFKTAIFIVFSFVLFSCEKVFFEKKQQSTNPKDNFEYLWNECDKKYSFFELKQVDWNQVYADYSLKIYEDMSNDSLFSVLASMLNELKDGHVNLVSSFNISFFNVQKLGQDQFDWRIVTDYYLPKNYIISGPFQHDFLLNNKDIGYIRFSAFTGTVNSTNLDYILNRYKNTKGLIIDLRENGGGAVTDVFSILSRLVETETLVNYSRIKNGKGHNDFSASEPVYVQPYDGVRYNKKIMMLVDRGTYSAGSFTSLATKALPNVILIGDTTGGGLGLPNGGQLPNGWTYRFSITQALDLNGNNYENGVPPDIIANFDWTNLQVDEIIERAIIEINQ
jgi:hypothetical protein